MTAMPSLRNIVNDTPADATDVEFNFDTIETHIANELINRDGSVTMSGELGLAGNPVSDLGAAPKQYVDAVLPPGMIAPYAGSAAPSGWLLADGSVVSQATYPALFAVVGSTYNTGGEGAGNFRLPDLRTKVPVGRHSGTSPFTTLGGAGGSKDAVVVSHNHTSPSHSHTGPSHTHSISHHHDPETTSSNGSHQHTASAAMGVNFVHRSGGTVQHGGGAGETFTDLAGVLTGGGGDHTHTASVKDFSGSSGSGGTGSTSSTAVTVNSSGVSGSNQNLQPYLIVNYIVKT